MKLKMADNAIDSLKLVKEYFYDYTTGSKHKKDNTNLELTIIFLHNSIELLLKSILINENELLIYEDLSKKPDDGTEMRKSYNNTLSLSEILIKKEGITNLITTYCSIFNVDKKIQIVLTDLEKLKDTVVCLGINESDNFEQILITIYESINIILNVLCEDLKKIDNYFEYDNVRDTLEPLVESYNDIFAPIQ
ncbi:TPA: hypothetical protein SOK46_002650 [Clostridioides difficile]|nr:hypothetical protein [Clostridioides difficile]HCQ5616593.1 hypothetical protein [Clostridioides difficile]HEK4597295.1 hypothetical protein [Clostridioides difficile]HEK5037713.1 hypothetical protein [Clostridioides difficile]HEK8690932.1 hypothetical protein [Clostridioides difficile]